MKRLFIPFLLCSFSLPMLADGDVPAFPGAEGYARYITGGRGGKVIHVTNLNDRGAGSLRQALSESGKRIIVFDVSGDIHLESALAISRGDVTVLGQTAPGGGITLCDQTVQNKADNVIIRFIRIRRGELSSVDDGADAAWGRNRTGVMLDHLSLSWSTDEVASWYDNRTFTMQWCVLAEGLASGHTKGTHSYGGIWGGKEASFHHNMIAHVNNRVPRINGARYGWTGYDTEKYPNVVEAERVDLRNNVYYNWGNGNGCYGGPGGGYCNIVNNYYKAGPATKNTTRVLQASVCDSSNGDKNHTELYGYASRYYIGGNYVTAASSSENYDWNGVIFDSGHYNFNGERYTKDTSGLYEASESDCYTDASGNRYVKVKLDEQIDAGDVTTHSATEAFEKMLVYGGASLVRDGHDVRYMEEARTGTATYTGSLNGWKGILDKCVDVIPDYTGDNPYPWLTPAAAPAPVDTDGDGMPDEWELAYGLDPDSDDSALYTLDPRGWYTNIEVYANSLVEHIMKGGNADALDAVDEYYPVLNKSGITNVEMCSEVVGVEYYNINGVRLTEPQPGVNIRRIRYADGRTETDKVIK